MGQRLNKQDRYLLRILTVCFQHWVWLQLWHRPPENSGTGRSSTTKCRTAAAGAKWHAAKRLKVHSDLSSLTGAGGGFGGRWLLHRWPSNVDSSRQRLTECLADGHYCFPANGTLAQPARTIAASSRCASRECSWLVPGYDTFTVNVQKALQKSKSFPHQPSVMYWHVSEVSPRLVTKTTTTTLARCCRQSLTDITEFLFPCKWMESQHFSKRLE